MLVSVKYLGADGETPTAIENGHVVKLGNLIEGEREVHIGTDVAANDNIKDVVLVASPELWYDERYRGLENFINEEGRISRGYRLHSGDFFSVTKEALAGVETPAVGNTVELAAGTKLNVAAEATNGSTVVGYIHAIETVGRYTFYVIRVA
jgi:hypothetical protein